VAAAKLLKDMHEGKQIEGRVSGMHRSANLITRLNHQPGKQWVYHALQDPNESATPEDLAAIDEQIVSFREETNSNNAEIKTLRATLSSLESTMSTSDLRTSVAAMEEEK